MYLDSKPSLIAKVMLYFVTATCTKYRVILISARVSGSTFGKGHHSHNLHMYFQNMEAVHASISFKSKILHSYHPAFSHFL